MRSWRFLLSTRWVAFLLIVLVLAALTWRLGEWQFDRLAETRHQNALIRQNIDGPAAPVEKVLSPGEPVAQHEEWRRVRARGHYVPENTVIVRYRTHEGHPGVQVVVPLETEQGPTLLVDRGWMPTTNQGGVVSLAEVPDPPEGTVTVVGWVRANGSGSATRVTNQSTRAISSEAISRALGLRTYQGFVELISEKPSGELELTPPSPPELSEGRHFFYGLQWWFFGVLALTGFVWMALDERRGKSHRRGRPHRARSSPPSTGTIAPETNDAAGESRNAATRPSSAGSP